VYYWDAPSKKPQGVVFSNVTSFINLFLILPFEEKEEKIARLFREVFPGAIVTPL